MQKKKKNLQSSCTSFEVQEYRSTKVSICKHTHLHILYLYHPSHLPAHTHTQPPALILIFTTFSRDVVAPPTEARASRSFSRLAPGVMDESSLMTGPPRRPHARSRFFSWYLVISGAIPREWISSISRDLFFFAFFRVGGVGRFGKCCNVVLYFITLLLVLCIACSVDWVFVMKLDKTSTCSPAITLRISHCLFQSLFTTIFLLPSSSLYINVTSFSS